MELSIFKYFPELTKEQKSKIYELGILTKEWNEKINLISRKDIDNIFDHHILHSLVFSKFISFKPDTKVLDLGTGGGLPGLPLAIMFPDVKFTLIDARKKKIMVVNDLIERLDLKNVVAYHQRAEELKEKFEFVVSRAVTNIAQLNTWCIPLIDTKNQRNIVPNGVFTSKGGDIKKELKGLSKKSFYEVSPLSELIKESYFEEKYMIYIQR